MLALSAHHTIFELVAGSLDVEEERSGRSLAGLRKLYEHASDYDGSKPHLRHLVFSDAQAAFDLFGQKSPHYALVADVLLALTHFQATRRDPTWGPLRPQAEAIRANRDQREQKWAQGLFDGVVRTLVPNAKSWFDVVSGSPLREAILAKAANGEGRDLLGRSIAVRAATYINRECSEIELDRLAKKARDQYPVSVALLDRLITTIIRDGRDMSKPERANSLWDYELTFSVGHKTKIDGAPVFLVSTDDEILSAAQSVSAGNVLHLDEYEKLVQQPWDTFREHVAQREAR